ncbi:rhomboid family intramembrane serine protease [Phycicoccus flavus]|uniref:rhomboid family intramembrane serine protease n=1 Tax=Phycicoccus flavus TaxID=2502783 RepID=UPI000FEBB195|nr:rhomboid family intramembrane serine protease [Phycicoccus flavus]NHA69350.1 rhomboid family intramembrane serine protease [Phycicoccus flavus]
MTDEQPVPPAEEQVPVCPRHPDRESYVRCQRCGRPACPDCQRPAAVGIQCVDCVREGAKSVRQARTVFGGSVTDGRPLVTMTLIGACVVVFVLQQVVPGLTSRLLFVPVLGDVQPWRFVTSVFAHGGLLHIALNMYALWIMGQYLEPMLGRARFAALYALAGFGGSVGLLLLASPPAGGVCTPGSAWCTGALGASGAVFGLFGAFIVLQRRLNRSAAGMYVIIGINAVIGFVYPGIAWQAHLGGIVVGAAAGAVLAYLGRGRAEGPLGERRHLGWMHWAGLAGIAVLLLLVTAVRYLAA